MNKTHNQIVSLSGGKDSTAMLLIMMEYAGRKSFVPAPYFRLGPDGKSAIEDMEELGMMQ